MRNQLRSSEQREKKSYSVFDMKYLWTIFTTHKKWFALSVVLCLFLAVAYVYFTRPAYNIVGKMMLIDRRQSNSSSLSSANAALLSQLPSSLSSSLNLGRSLGSESEKEILKTKLLAKDVVEDLGLYTEIRLQKNLKSRLLYKNTPVNVTVSKECLHAINEGLKTYSIRMTIDKSDAGFTFEGVLKKNKKKAEIAAQSFAKLPAVIHTEIGDLTFTENILPTDDDRKPFEKDYRLKVTVIPPMMAAKKFVNRLTIGSASKKATSIIQISLQDEHVTRGVDFVNSLVAHYNDRSNQDRQEEAAKNEAFINGRLAMIDDELNLKDADWEKVKKQYQVTDARVDAEEVMKKKSTYESQIVNIGIQQQMLDYLSEYVNNPANMYELIPVTIIGNGRDSIPLIGRHNQLVNERKKMLKSMTEQSLQVTQNKQMITELHPAIQTAILRNKEALMMQRTALEREYNKYLSRVGDVPEQERVMTDVSRQRNIKQGVFVSLLQKREEMAMELANTTDKGKLIDETQAQKKLKPKTMVALLLSLIFGLLIPYIVFFTRRTTKKQIDSEIDLKVTTTLPLAGTIPALGQGDVDDAFRLVRNNILQLLGEGKKTILVTSANKGDGKTFCATHLAEAFIRMGEKTICRHLLNVLPAGSTDSVHPADLLAHKDLRQSLASLRESYDIIILDGPEMDPSNETLIDGLADVTCFVCRAGKTTKAAVERLGKTNSEHRQSSPCIVLNQ